MKLKYTIFSALLALLILGACRGIKLGKSSNVAGSQAEIKLGWKLGAQAYTFRLYSFFEAVQKIDSCQLRYVEAYPGQQIGAGISGTMGPDMDQATRKLVLKMLKDQKVKLVAFGVTGGKTEADWIRLFDFCRDMGIHTITSEPDEKDIPLLSRLADRYAINVAIHNHPDPAHYWNPEVVLRAIRGQSKRIGACADIGHWVRSGLDPVESLKKLEGHILHAHMKDLNEKSKAAHDVHWGEGVCNIPGVIAELKRQNFKGAISAEYEYNWQSNSQDVAASVAGFRQLTSAAK